MAFESQAVRDARIDVGAVLGAVVRRLPRVIAVTLALLALTFVILMFMPRLYESSASILVEPRSNIYIRASNEQAPSLSGGEAGVVSSQIELIKSRDTLLQVIDRLDLRSVPEFNGSAGEGFSPMALVGRLLGRSPAAVSVEETVLNNLYDRMTVIQERDSRIISVLVRSTNPHLAADIANAVANAHVTRRAELSLSDTAEASGWLRDEIARLRVSVNEAETAVANFKVANDLFIGSNNTSLLDQQLSTISSQISAAQERKNAARSRAALIRGMIERGQAIDGIADVRDSAMIQQLTQEKARLQGEKAQRSATLLGNHPTIQALTAQITELDNQIRIEGRRVADALDAEAQIEADLETSLQADLANAKSTASTATQDTVTLDGLQREATAQRNLLEGYLQRYNEATSRTETNSALPDVRVVTGAAPSITPASPKTALIMLAVGIVALATQIGVIIFGELMSGRAIAAAPERQRRQDELEESPYVADDLEGDRAEPSVSSARFSRRAADVDDVIYMRPSPAMAALPPVLDQEPEVGFVEDVDLEHEEAQPPVFVKEPVAEQPVTDEPVRPTPSKRLRPSEASVVGLADITSDMMMGKTHLVILAAHGDHDDSEVLAEALVGDALGRGLSVALIDAGSGRISEDAGLTDLSIDDASFGDVVHKSADNSFAEVPWGQGTDIDRASQKPFTLVEALGDIYEVVVLMTGRVDEDSSLPMFEGLEGRLVLVASDDDDFDAVAETREDLMRAGFPNCEIAAAPARVAA